MRFDFYSRTDMGHRAEYVKFCQSQLGGRRVGVRAMLVTNKPLLFLMIEENFILYFCIAILRSLFGLKTTGLAFRAKECVESKDAKLKVKYILLRVLKTIGRVKTLSIVPFFAYPKAEEVCDDWVYDFQFWDREFLESITEIHAVNSTVKKILEIANGRRVVCAVGKQDIDKGFDFYAMTYSNSKALRDEFLFVAGGKIQGIDKKTVSTFKNHGGYLIDRRISDDELVALYHVADVVWACYTPIYDQSSGVLGRALQYGRTAIVRKGSLASILAVKQSESVITCHFHSTEPLTVDLLRYAAVPRGSVPSNAITYDYKNEFLYKAFEDSRVY